MRTVRVPGFTDETAGFLLCCAGLVGCLAQLPWLFPASATAADAVLATRTQTLGIAYLLVATVGLGWRSSCEHEAWRASCVAVVALQFATAGMTAAHGPTAVGPIASSALLALLATRAWRRGLHWSPVAVLLLAAVPVGLGWTRAFWLTAAHQIGSWCALALLGLALRRAARRRMGPG